jgi:glutamate formiminotransferase
MLPLEAVPNFSEGRDTRTIDAIGSALAQHAHVLDLHVDRDHHRCVYTLAGDGPALEEALAAAARVATERIDLTVQRGAHPRIGAIDVVPLVALAESDREEAQATALRVADRIAALGVPVFLYADSGGGRRPHDLRRGGPAGLQERLDAGELAPDRGPARLHPTAGAAIVGARGILAAFNVNLRTRDVAVARELARRVRARDGGLPGVRALGLELPEQGIVQVSMNIEDPARTPLYRVVEFLRAEARTFGVELDRSELVGLLPAAAVASAASYALSLPELDGTRVIEAAVLRAEARTAAA